MKTQILRRSKACLLSAASGLLAGLAASVFLILLDHATALRLAQPGLVWGLPFAGFAIGWIYLQFGKDVTAGNNLILDEIHDPRRTLPLRMAPLVLMGTLATHLFGGSAGREGTAVQMGASLSDQLGRYFPLSREERRSLLVAGAGAGFGAAIGTPWAGMIFGMEVIQVGKLRLFAWVECFIASFVGYFITRWLGAPHSHFPETQVLNYSVSSFLFLIPAAVAFGLMTRLFIALTHGVERFFQGAISYPPLRPALGGLILALLFLLPGTLRYSGLGLETIQEAFVSPASFFDPTFKALFTSLTLGSGFKGGEFIPLVFMGATLGSALALVLPLSFQLLAAMGFAASFAGAANTPLACTLMAMELFGYRVGPFALVACYTSYLCSSAKGIYPSQRLVRGKWDRVRNLFERT